MANEESALVPSGLRNQMVQSKYATDETFTEVATASEFLPRLQLFTGNNKEVKRKLIGSERYGLVVARDRIQDLGDTVEIIPYAWRPKAMEVGGDEVISVYNPRDPEFIRIKSLSSEQNSGCMAGIEFLVWIPSIKRFASLYMASKSNKVEAPMLREKLDQGKAVMLDSVLASNKKYEWYTIRVNGCSSALEMPEDEIVLVEVNKFNNPPENETEKVEETDTRAR